MGVASPAAEAAGAAVGRGDEMVNSWQPIVMVTALGIGLWLVLVRRFLHEPAAGNVPQHLSAPPRDWSPLLVSNLLSWGYLILPDLAVLDLVRRGALRVVVEKAPEEGRRASGKPKDYAVVRDQNYAHYLTTSDKCLIGTVLFHNISEEAASLETIGRIARSVRDSASERLDGWRGMATAECDIGGLVERPGRRVKAGGVCLGSALVGFGAMNFTAPDMPAFLPCLMGILLVLATFLIRRMSPEGAKAAREWRAFARYLARFAERKYSPPKINECERYFDYAMALNVEKQAQAQFVQLFGNAEGTGLSFSGWRFADGKGIADIRTGLIVSEGFRKALGKTLSHYETRSGGAD